MQTQEQEVLQHLADWLSEGACTWLCTVVATVGSSPRPVGSMVAVTVDGRQMGSVSGGCVEEDLLQRLRRDEWSGDAPELVEYGVSAEENERLGLPCGGRLTLLLQKMGQPDQPWIDAILTALEQRQCTARELDLVSGATRVNPVAQFSPLALAGGELRQCFGPRMRMLLVGAGQLARCLAELGEAMDYEVLLTDPRKQALAQWEGPEVRRLPGMPDDVIREHANDPHSVIITLTHDPRIDEMALMEALESDAWYVGALGSRRTTEQRLARLRQLDIPEHSLGRLHAPVGMDIGSKTPMEIAVSIMAELIRLRRRGEPAR